MTKITAEMCRLAMLGDICSEWTVLNAVWNRTIDFDLNSRWGKELNDLSNLSKYSEVTSSKTIESFIILFMWMNYTHQ
jgi:hypothetical protein